MMKSISYETERKIKGEARSEVVELLKNYGIDEEENTSTPTDDRNFIDNLVFNLFLLANSYNNGWDIPGDWQLDPKVSQNLNRDEIDQRIDTAIVNTVRSTSFVGFEGSEALQAGDLNLATKPFGKSKYVVAPRLVLDKDTKYIDGYYQLRDIFLLIMSKIRSS